MLVRQQIHTLSIEAKVSIIESIIKGNLVAARKQLDEAVALIMERKLLEMKKRLVAELDLSKEKPATEIEDRRKEQGVNSSIKTDLGGEQEVNRQGKGNLPTKQTVNTADKGDLKEDIIVEARIKIVKARIRNGKIQRRKKISNVPGMTLRGGKLQRMSPTERRHRKMGQRRGKIKRKSKMTRILIKRQRSMRKRKSMGL